MLRILNKFVHRLVHAKESQTMVGFIKKKDAEAAARKIESAMDENQYIEPSNGIFQEFVQDWFYGHYQNRIKETTVSNRAYLLDSCKDINYHEKYRSEKNAVPILGTAFFMIISSYFFSHK